MKKLAKIFAVVFVLSALALAVVACNGGGSTATTGCNGNHTWDDGTVTTAPTCLTSGFKLYTCTVCGKGRSESVAATGHTWGDWKTTQAATCTQNGQETSTCTSCGTQQSRSVAALGHIWENQYTSSDADTHTRTCTREGCGAKVSANHVWSNGETKVAATCEQMGRKAVTCLICNYEREILIAALPHSFQNSDYNCISSEYVSAVAATCEEEGCSGYYYCTSCRNYYSSPDKDGNLTLLGDQKPTTAALGHNVGDDNRCTICKQLVWDKVVTLTATNLELGKSYAEGTATIGYVKWAWNALCTQGNGIQWRTKNDVTSTLWNTSAFVGVVQSIELTLNSTKGSYDNEHYLYIEFANSSDFSDAVEVQLDTVKDQLTYTVTPGGSYKYVRLSHGISYSLYIDSITFNIDYECEHTQVSQVAEAAATCTAVGCKAHYKCDDCGQLFSDAEHTTKVTLADLTISKIDHTYTTKYQNNSNGTHSQVCDVCGNASSSALDCTDSDGDGVCDDCAVTIPATHSITVSFEVDGASADQPSNLTLAWSYDNGTAISDITKVVEGRTVVLTITNLYHDIEVSGATESNGTYTIAVGTGDVAVSVKATSRGTETNPFSVEEALAVAGSLEKGAYAGSGTSYYITGTVTEIGTTGTYLGNVYIADVDDSSKTILIYSVSFSDEVKAVYVGDTVTLTGYICNYDGTLEISSYKDSGTTNYCYFKNVVRGKSSITVGNADNATVSDLSAASGENGSTFTFKVSADEGYYVYKVTVNGTKVTAASDGTYTGTIAGPTTIEVTTYENSVSVAELNFDDPSNDTSVSNYKSTIMATRNGQQWTIGNFNNNSRKWTYIMAGAKSTTDGTATISTTFTGTVSQITVNALLVRGTATVKLEVVSGETVIETQTKDITSTTATDITFDLTSDTAGCTYTLTFTYTNSTSKNGVVQVNGITYLVK